MSENYMSDENRLKRLCSNLIAELQNRIPDRADSSLPKWEHEARQLGVEGIGQRPKILE